jgi:hypothetical protein
MSEPVDADQGRRQLRARACPGGHTPRRSEAPVILIIRRGGGTYLVTLGFLAIVGWVMFGPSITDRRTVDRVWAGWRGGPIATDSNR